MPYGASVVVVVVVVILSFIVVIVFVVVVIVVVIVVAMVIVMDKCHHRLDYPIVIMFVYFHAGILCVRVCVRDSFELLYTVNENEATTAPTKRMF